MRSVMVGNVNEQSKTYGSSYENGETTDLSGERKKNHGNLQKQATLWTHLLDHMVLLGHLPKH